MKQLIKILVLLLIANTAIAQAPQAIPYQAVARNSSGAILASTNISVRFSIRDSVATGTIKYRETHSVTTTAQGLFTANIGGGTPVTGIFSNINWATNSKFLQVEMDPTGGSSYIELGTQQMMSVPYSIFSNNGFPSGSNGDIMYHNGTSWVKLNGGTDGQVLTMSGGRPTWITPGTSTSALTLGAEYGGGKIAYILQPGEPGYVAGQTKGLIAAPNDQGMNIQWGCYGTTVGGTIAPIGSGAANTSIVSTACGAGTAARICQDLVFGGYDDWYLPSINELQKLYLNRWYVGGFVNERYWSSTEFSPSDARMIHFADGILSNNDKTTSYPFYIRAIRSFSCPETPANIAGSTTTCVGNTTSLSSTTIGGSWTSSNNSIATVNSSGVVTGIAQGTTTISYTLTSGCGSASVTQIVTINPIPSAGTITGTAAVNAGSTTTLSNTTSGGIWTSSNTAIATVGSTGVVTGVAAGTATISYTVTNSCGSSVATIVVTANALTVGASYGGGIIAYILQPGDPGYIAGETHGLIAAQSDQSTGIQWYNGSYITTGAVATQIGTGNSNTNLIVTNQGIGTYAASICLGLTLNGYDDWYLPSLEEIRKMYANRVILAMSVDTYWSSSEDNSGSAMSILIGSGSTPNSSKSHTYHVRAIRSF